MVGVLYEVKKKECLMLRLPVRLRFSCLSAAKPFGRIFVKFSVGVFEAAPSFVNIGQLTFVLYLRALMYFCPHCPYFATGLRESWCRALAPNGVLQM
jgi:hypothetical protein